MTEAQGRSLAFQALVDGPDDLAGLLAYALYKQNLRERVVAGLPAMPAGQRNPTSTERNVYRGDAQARLAAFADQATRAARARIVAEAIGTSLDDWEIAMVNAIAASGTALERTINQRTRLISALGVNLLAWIVSLALTILIVSSFYLPNWQADIIRAVRSAATSPTHPP